MPLPSISAGTRALVGEDFMGLHWVLLGAVLLIKGRGQLYDPPVVDACTTLFREAGFSFV